MGKMDTTEFQVGKELKSGIVVGTTRDTTAAEHAFAALPEDVKENLEHSQIEFPKVLVPEGSITKKHVIIPTEDQTKRVIDEQLIPLEKSKKRRLSTTQLAQLATSPRKFLSRYLGDKERYPDNVRNENRQSVLHTLFHLDDYEKDFYALTKEGLNPEIIQRISHEEKYFDKNEGEKKTYTVSRPGALEHVAAQGIDIVEMNKAFDASPMIYGTINALLSLYRQNNGLELLPEMADLTATIISTLENIEGYPKKARYLLYEILEQITVSGSQAEMILGLMDKYHDFDQALAYSLMCRLVRERKFGWIDMHEERRQELLSKLTGTPQELFDQFDELFAQSNGLVCGSNFDRPRSGKVGMEIELVVQKEKFPTEVSNKDISSGIVKNSSHWQRMEKDFVIDNQMKGEEVKKSKNALTHNTEYLESLNVVRRWSRDFVKYVKSIHLHFDRVKHPFRPAMGELYGNENDAIRKNDLGTWEIRSLNLPKDSSDMHPARIEDAINLYLSATTDPDGRKDDPTIHISSEIKPTLIRMIWGYVCSYISEPEGRLSLLMALHDSYMLQNINPLALAHTYDKESCLTIVKELREKLLSSFDQTMLAVLRTVTEHDGKSEIDFKNVIGLNEKMRREVFKVLCGDKYYVHREKELFDQFAQGMFRRKITRQRVHFPEFEYLLYEEEYNRDKESFRGAIEGASEDILKFQNMLRERRNKTSDNHLRFFYDFALMHNAKENPESMRSASRVLNEGTNLHAELFLSEISSLCVENKDILLSCLEDLNLDAQDELIRVMSSWEVIRKDVLRAVLFSKHSIELRAWIVFKYGIWYLDDSAEIFEDFLMRGNPIPQLYENIFQYLSGKYQYQKYNDIFVRLLENSDRVVIRTKSAQILAKDYEKNVDTFFNVLSQDIPTVLRHHIYAHIIDHLPDKEEVLLEYFKKEKKIVREFILEHIQTIEWGKKEGKGFVEELRKIDTSFEGIVGKVLSKVFKKQ